MWKADSGEIESHATGVLGQNHINHGLVYSDQVQRGLVWETETAVALCLWRRRLRRARRCEARPKIGPSS